MNITITQEHFEKICEQVHKSWLEEKKQQGFHAPVDCPNWMIKPILKFNKCCNNCHPDMYPYNDLPEDVKEYDRITVRTVLSAIEKL